MTISELISELEKIREIKGDVEIVYDAGDYDYQKIELTIDEKQVLIQGKPDYWW